MKLTVKKLTVMAMLTAVSLTIFIVEAQIPMPVPIPGAKLGLANTVTLFALFYRNSNERGPNGLTAVDAFLILVCRIILGAIFTGRIVAFIYSIAGGLLGFATQAVMKRVVTSNQIWVCGAIGAVFHNLGQVLAAMLVMGTPVIAAYLPVLIITGIITGCLTGLIAQFSLDRLAKK